jgi:hypothetical protein
MTLSMSAIQSDNSHPVAVGVDDESAPFGIMDPVILFHIDIEWSSCSLAVDDDYSDDFQRG